MRRSSGKKHRNHFPLLVGLCVLGFAGGSGFAMKDQIIGKATGYAPGEITGSVVAAPQQLGPSGFPIPRFVTLKAGKVNVRRGPSNDHAVAFVFQMKGLPVEITAESDNWRKIRDSDGAEGWILQSMLTGRRNAYVAKWNKDKIIPLYDARSADSALSARLEVGVLATIANCDGTWCEINASGHKGFAEQAQLWGVYPGEVVE